MSSLFGFNTNECGICGKECNLNLRSISICTTCYLDKDSALQDPGIMALIAKHAPPVSGGDHTPEEPDAYHQGYASAVGDYATVSEESIRCPVCAGTGVQKIVSWCPETGLPSVHGERPCPCLEDDCDIYARISDHVPGESSRAAALDQYRRDGQRFAADRAHAPECTCAFHRGVETALRELGEADASPVTLTEEACSHPLYRVSQDGQDLGAVAFYRMEGHPEGAWTAVTPDGCHAGPVCATRAEAVAQLTGEDEGTMDRYNEDYFGDPYYAQFEIVGADDEPPARSFSDLAIDLANALA